MTRIMAGSSKLMNRSEHLQAYLVGLRDLDQHLIQPSGLLPHGNHVNGQGWKHFQPSRVWKFRRASFDARMDLSIDFAMTSLLMVSRTIWRA